MRSQRAPRASRSSAAALAAVAALACWAHPGAAAGADGRGRPQVAPGVYLAKASRIASDDARVRPRRRAASRRPRIVGGSTTTIAAWPWQVALTETPPPAGNAFQRQFCGGSLLAPTIVVTAAHCAYDENAGAFVSAAEVQAVTGRTTLSNGGEGQEIPWSDYYVPVNASGQQLYNPATAEWDFVIAKLAAPSPASNSAPILVAGADEAAFWAPGDENAFVTGWGTTVPGVPGSASDTLRAAQVDVIANSTCEASYGTAFRAQTMMCAGEVAGGQDTCQGDSGGPLVVPVGGGASRLVGDTSWGTGCALPGFPGVYGRLAADPMCTVLRNAVVDVAGADVVGPGGCAGGPDATAPETQLTAVPKNKTKRKRARFEFSASEPATFACALDGREQFRPCESPFSVKVRKGRHEFEVRATDAAGNSDPTPASDRWRFKKKKKKRGR